MAFIENMTIKEIATNILQSLKIIARKTPEPNPFGWTQSEIKSGTLTTVTTVSMLTDVGFNIWQRENLFVRANSILITKNLVVKS